MSNAPLSIDPVFNLKEILLVNLRNGRWRPGEKLPTERKMSEFYAVGRSTVRRALAQLKELGLITQIVGSGTYVTRDVADRLPKPLSAGVSISPSELMEARFIFEPGLIDLAVRNGTAEDFSELETCCRNAEEADTLEQFEHWNGVFHQAVADATHNNFVISVFELISTVRERGEWGVLKLKTLTPERRVAFQKEHRVLLEALQNRDTETATRSMLAHLTHVRRNLFGY
jgi:DNA-binding FadR family transcriptional regulator